ncbi:inorganic phosphate transporter [Dysgonomonas sp. 520]|uniref:inorganic phosphate transporter n=1 Tax=Dysgonomonas sp. 520 TaxID=2302931 RepID=UPI0013D6127D|nr:inorganic phosphate transporter [Dysgonomonas sp. 520]NDW08810.1 inorganic phosphate transporter [Dysgonomonas sp. 520]
MTALIVIIVLAIIFDFINGFHDAANSVATVVSSKVLTPRQAVLWAAFFNFVALFIAKYMLGGFGIADTVAKTVEPDFITFHVVIAGLVAAITWNLITWWFGIPSSSSHTLIGGFAGAGIASAGFGAVHLDTVGIIVLFIFVAPLIGIIGGNIITLITLHLAKNVKPGKADYWFKRLQLISSAMLSIGHGLNDSQKVMGIIGVTLIAATKTIPDLPHFMQTTDINTDMHIWVPVVCFTAIALGTMAGGFKIMKTMGNRITKITPLEGFCSQVAGSITLFITEKLHVPVSTTHVITGSIIGVGSVKRLAAVRWGVTKNLLVAWVITIPISAFLAAFVFWLLSFVM